MPGFKKLSGNYLEVAKALQLEWLVPPKPDAMDDYRSQINKDTQHRLPPVVNFKESVDDVNRRIRRMDNLQEEQRYFCQGDLDARSLPITYLRADPEANDRLVQAEMVGEPAPIDTLSFIFTDNTNPEHPIDYGFSLTYFRQDPKEGELNVPLEERKRPYILSIYKNAHHSTLEERQVLVVSHADLVRANTENFQDIGDVSAAVADFLRVTPENPQISTPEIYQIIVDSGVLHGENMPIEAFDELKARLPMTSGNMTSGNFDHRDERQPQVQAFLEAALADIDADSAGDEQLKADLDAYVNNIRHKMATDIHFFRDDRFDALMESMPVIFAAFKARKAEILESRVKPQSVAETPSTETLQAKAESVLESIDAVQSQGELSPDDKAQLEQIKAKLSLVIEDPTDTKILSEALHEVVKTADTAAKKTSSLWQELGELLLDLAGIALVVLGVITALPTQGVGLGFAVAGVALLLRNNSDEPQATVGGGPASSHENPATFFRGALSGLKTSSESRPDSPSSTAEDTRSPTPSSR